jgi:uncharacterized protein YaaQ
MTDLEIDRLVIINVSRPQSKKLMAKLNRQQFYFTIIDSNNSLFLEATVLLLLGLNHTRLDILDQLVQQYCQPYRKLIPVQIRAAGETGQFPVLESLEGGATMFSLPVEHFEQI